MALIQIPLEPPTQQVPEQGDLFDAQTWESAYREMHDFPTLLIQTRDELARSRKREALWISLFAHAVLIILILNSPKFEKYLPHRAVMLIHPGRDNKITFTEMPPDTQNLKPPKTDMMSDKNRVAMSKAPKLDRDQLKKILDASRQGRPGPAAPQPRPQPTPPAAQAQATPQPQSAQPQPAPPPAQAAKLQTPPVDRKPAMPSPFTTRPMSADQEIQQAARATVSKPRYGGDDGDLGLGQRQRSARVGAAEIISDTMGVDFGPYLQQVVHKVKQNWYNIIPPSAEAPLYKKGKLSIEFVILKDGQVAGMQYVISSGDVALDRAAYGGITFSNPFPPLPKEFGGKQLELRFTFYYNPDPNEADLQ